MTVSKCDGGLDALAQHLQAPAFVEQHFAAQQIHGLDAVRAFVDHVEALVAPILLHRKVTGVAIAAVDLDGQTVAFQAPFAGPAFHDRGQHFQQPLGLVQLRFITCVEFIDQTGAVKPQSQSALAIGFLRQQHPLDVGVFNQAHRRLRRVFACGPDRPALGSGFGVVQ